MLASTLREHFAEEYPDGLDGIDHEEIAWTVGDWFSSHGMEIVADDRKFMEEIGEDIDDYMNFDDEQLNRIDEIYEAAENLCELMITPIPGRTFEKQYLSDSHYYQIAEDVARLLNRFGFDVYFPTHCHNADGTECISDGWQ